MKNVIILWAGAILITYLTIFLYNLSDTDYPVTGTIGVEGKKVTYRLNTVHNLKGNYEVLLRSDVEGLQGKIVYNDADSKEKKEVRLNAEPMILKGEIENPGAGKSLQYSCELNYNGKSYRIPEKGEISLTFVPEVPATVKNIFYGTLFGGLLLGVRSGLEYFNRNRKLKKLSLFTFGMFFLYSIAATPFYKTYQIDAINKKVPFITELFTLNALLYLILWTTAVILIFKKERWNIPALVYPAVAIIIYLIIRF